MQRVAYNTELFRVMAAYQLIRRSRYPLGRTTSSVSRLYGVSRMVHSLSSTMGGRYVGAKQSAVIPVSFYRCRSAIAATRSVVLALPVSSRSYGSERCFHILTSTAQQGDNSTSWQFGITSPLVAKKLVDLIMKGWSEHNQIVPQLPRKPPHPQQAREREVQQLQKMFKKLQNENKEKEAVVVYITGRSGSGRTQLAREFGSSFFRQHSTSLPYQKVPFVGTLDATNKDTFIHSYYKLAMELDCESEIMISRNSSGKTGEFESLDLLSVAMRKKLRHRMWLLIVDNLGAMNNWEGRGAVNADWNTLWPQPGEEEWGEGRVLVTTQDRTLVKRDNPLAGEHCLSEMMSVEVAVNRSRLSRIARFKKCILRPFRR